MYYELGKQLLVIKDVSLVLGGNTILKNVNAELDDNIEPGGPIRGQVVGFLAPSGMGKTQLFRCIAGLQQPTQGTIFVNGDTTPVRAGEVGVVAQDYPLLETRTVLNNLMVAAGLSGVKEKEAKDKSLALLDQFDLRSIRNHYPCQLSGGQRQRIAIFQQLLCSRFFLLMDEPFSGLDPLAKNRVADLITQVANADELSTVIITSHDIRTVLAVADLVWLLGRDRDEQGQPIPGARIQKVYDLKEMDLCWHPGITKTQKFLEFVGEVEHQFEFL